MGIIDRFRKILERRPSFSLQTRSADHYPGIIRGEIFWELRDSKTNELQESGHHKNVVTLDASILLARFIKFSTSVAHQSEPSFGALALAVGTGDINWINPSFPPAGTNTQRSLFNEVARKQIASSNFIAADGSISSVPTNVIDLTTSFGESEAVGGLMEMGLVGGDISTNMSLRNPVLPPNGAYDPTINLVGLDTLLNYVTFPLISKASSSTLSWTWRLSF